MTKHTNDSFETFVYSEEEIIGILMKMYKLTIPDEKEKEFFLDATFIGPFFRYGMWLMLMKKSMISGFTG